VRSCFASITMMLFSAGCGSPAASTPAAVPTPTPLIDSITLASSEPPTGGVVHAGLPNPAQSLDAGVTTGLTMRFSVVSAVDRAAKLQVYLVTGADSVCLTNAAPVDVPSAPLVNLTAGVAQTVTVTQFLLTSECWYPGVITKGAARLVAPSTVGTSTPAFYETQFPVAYTVVQ
jgi:hypothetical protein